MMKYDKKAITKLVVLGVILLGLWVFIGIRYAKLSRHWKAKIAAQERAHAAAAASQRASSEQGRTPEATSRVAALVTPVPPPQSDPFRPMIPPRSRRAAARSAAATSPETQGAAPFLPPPPSAASTSDRSSLHVTGIIIGTPNTAVLRLGDEHYVVREGYFLDNRVRVQTIERDTVTLQDSRGTYVLRLGR